MLDFSWEWYSSTGLSHHLGPIPRPRPRQCFKVIGGYHDNTSLWSCCGSVYLCEWQNRYWTFPNSRCFMTCSTFLHCQHSHIPHHYTQFPSSSIATLTMTKPAPSLNGIGNICGLLGSVHVSSHTLAFPASSLQWLKLYRVMLPLYISMMKGSTWILCAWAGLPCQDRSVQGSGHESKTYANREHATWNCSKMRVVNTRKTEQTDRKCVTRATIHAHLRWCKSDMNAKK